MKLLWSEPARANLLEIRRHSVRTWGKATATNYLNEIRETASAIAKNPGLARKLRGDYRIVRVRSHYLVCHCDDTKDVLTIARIPHIAMDIERHLPPAD